MISMLSNIETKKEKMKRKRQYGNLHNKKHKYFQMRNYIHDLS